MGRKRRRSSRSRTTRPASARPREGGRVQLRRNQPLTWRWALLLLVLLALLAAGTDYALISFISDHYAKHGHLALPLGIIILALGLTALTLYGCVASWRGVRKRLASRRTRGASLRCAKGRTEKGHQ